jgi:hypothetical protein
MGEPITDAEKHDLENRISIFLKDPDPEININLDGSMRKINYAFKRLKKMVSQGGPGGGQSGTSIMNTEGEQNREKLKQFQITPDELIRLKEILEQRDTEIAVLVNTIVGDIFSIESSKNELK